MRLRQLDRRVRLLEAALTCRAVHDPLLILVESAVSPRKLRVDEHLVIDRFRDTGNVVWGQERITSDLGDDGHTCAPGGYIKALLERFHQTCYWQPGRLQRLERIGPVAERADRLSSVFRFSRWPGR